jgi:hypothetical protein
MDQSSHARASALLEEAVTILFCLVDEVYQNIYPDTQRYERLKKSSRIRRLKLSFYFSNSEASKASAPSYVTFRDSSAISSL